MGPALAGVDAVYLALPPFRPDEAEVGAAIVAAAKAAGVTRIVKLSAAGVENNPESGHRRLELAVEESGLQWVHLRPTFFHENFIHLYGGPIKAEGVLYLPAGDGKSGFIAASDIGDVAAVALLSDVSGEAWTLTGPESLDHDEVAARLAEAIGKPMRYVNIPPEAFENTLRSYGSNEIAVATMSGLYAFVRAGWAAGLTDQVEQVLGRKPVAIGDWARAHAKAWG